LFKKEYNTIHSIRKHNAGRVRERVREVDRERVKERERKGERERERERKKKRITSGFHSAE
jgi:hypothetical protein